VLRNKIQLRKLAACCGKLELISPRNNAYSSGFRYGQKNECIPLRQSVLLV
jgi:hypothetical protein